VAHRLALAHLITTIAGLGEASLGVEELDGDAITFAAAVAG
jgi:hypothetical protein